MSCIQHTCTILYIFNSYIFLADFFSNQERKLQILLLVLKHAGFLLSSNKCAIFVCVFFIFFCCSQS